MDQAGRSTRILGTVLIIAAIVTAVISNHSVQWAVGVTIVLAVVGVGLRIEAVLSHYMGGRVSLAPPDVLLGDSLG